MLLLLFHIAGDIYAIDSTHIVEVLPLVLLRKIHQAPKHITGVFQYRNCIVPVVDLCQLIQGEPCRSRYSTRIMMLHYTTKKGNRAYVGLLAERVTETLDQPDLMPSAENDDGSYLGEVLMHEQDMIQRLRWEALVSDVQNVALIGGGTG
ncbi:chemotaxis protein CheW [Leptolyngbya sp. FACHB-17]|uniref:chemotaxis protein CheW n=1 Tax=unclassified Leptolyngbya TaxID=2650499 RepID=UPI0016816383|nr:chemotaxis protein CheW [Leptolyngbya sp. FACHB-17]MBD2081751.1 chemotaxis protein CheW [Leptolyngbya sp. FACHB-17]